MTALVVPIIDFGANKHIYSLYLFAGFIRIMKQLYVLYESYAVRQSDLISPNVGTSARALSK